MKSYDKDLSWKRKDKQHFRENKSQAFRCDHCRVLVVINEYIGTKNRNHCNFCLWSKHVDIEKGDRNADCHSGMQPIGLTMKREGYSRWGELMLIHVCTLCQKIVINRLAADDNTDRILCIFQNSENLKIAMKQALERQPIVLLNEEDRDEVEMQLFGK